MEREYRVSDDIFLVIHAEDSKYLFMIGDGKEEMWLTEGELNKLFDIYRKLKND